MERTTHTKQILPCHTTAVFLLGNKGLMGSPSLATDVGWNAPNLPLIHAKYHDFHWIPTENEYRFYESKTYRSLWDSPWQPDLLDTFRTCWLFCHLIIVASWVIFQLQLETNLKLWIPFISHWQQCNRIWLWYDGRGASSSAYMYLQHWNICIFMTKLVFILCFRATYEVNLYYFLQRSYPADMMYQ